jgi:hypothetical protein
MPTAYYGNTTQIVLTKSTLYYKPMGIIIILIKYKNNYVI